MEVDLTLAKLLFAFSKQRHPLILFMDFYKSLFFAHVIVFVMAISSPLGLTSLCPPLSFCAVALPLPPTHSKSPEQCAMGLL